MTHDENSLRIATVLGDVLVHPADRLGDVVKDGGHLHVGQEAIARRDEDEALVYESLRLDLDVGPIARYPAAAVNPEDHREILRTFGRVDVHPLPRAGWLGVGNVPLHIDLGWRGDALGLRQRWCERCKGQEGEKRGKWFHKLNRAAA